MNLTRGVVAVMLSGLAACSESPSGGAGVVSVNGVSGAISAVSSDASVTIAVDATARTLDLRAVESDPLFVASAASGILQADIDGWDAAAGFVETDPAFAASPAAGILAADVTAWTAAYGWGDHSQRGYLTAELNAGLDCVGCVTVGALAFDPATQAELDVLASQLPTGVDGLTGGTIVSSVAVNGTLDAVGIRQNGNSVCDASGNCVGYAPAARYVADLTQTFPAAAGAATVRWLAPTGGAAFEAEPFLTGGGARLAPAVTPGIYRITARLQLVPTSGTLGAVARLSHSVHGVIDLDSAQATGAGTSSLDGLVPMAPGEYVEVTVTPGAGSDLSMAAPSHVSIQWVSPLP